MLPPPVKTSVRAWVSRLKEKRPHLPDHLTLDVERSRLEILKPWTRRCKELREKYPDIDIDPNLADRFDGKKQVLSCIVATREMTPEQREAWQDLFTCLAAKLASMATEYFQKIAGKGKADLEDILGHLPFAFLYVLSSFDPERTGDHEGTYSHDGGTRLITWLHKEGRRHIKRYVRRVAGPQGKEPESTHRLRRVVHQVRREVFIREGREARWEEIAPRLKESSPSRKLSEETIERRGRQIQREQKPVSLESRVPGTSSSGNDSLTWKEVSTASSSGDVFGGDGFDETSAVFESARKKGEKAISATRKILTAPPEEKGEPLSFSECFAIGI